MSTVDVLRNGARTAPGPSWSDYVSLNLARLARCRLRTLRADDRESYEEFYEEFFLQKDLEARFMDERRLVRNRTILDFLDRKAPAESNILDVGCGVGEVLDALPRHYPLSGLEYAKSNVVHASKLLGDRARILQGSIYEMPFAADSQDVCICLEVLEHIEDDVRAVRDIARVLKPGGRLLASVPYTYYWPQYQKLIGHFRHYTRTSFERLFQSNGLTVEAHLPNYPNWHLAYSRQYCRIRAQAILFGWMRRPSVYSFRWPWSPVPSLEAAAKKLESLKAQDARLNYKTLPTSTFLVVRKPA